MKSIHLFRIAELNVKIVFEESCYNNIRLLPSFEPFRVEEFTEDGLFFQLYVDDQTKPISKEHRKRVRAFDTGNGKTIVDQVDNGGYQYIIKNVQEVGCCLLQANPDFSNCRCALNGNYNMRSFGLNNALMLIFAFAGSQIQTILLHASLVRQDGYGYAFIAESGTGKSTQVSFWLRYLPGCDLMNDDNPIVRIINGLPYIYGSPWSGKTPCYRNTKAKLGAITRIDRAKSNSIEKMNTIDAFISMLTSCSNMKWDKVVNTGTGDTITKIIETTGIYILHCLPNKEAAEICNKMITKSSPSKK
jgi:hypothetical protein